MPVLQKSKIRETLHFAAPFFVQNRKKRKIHKKIVDKEEKLDYDKAVNRM